MLSPEEQRQDLARRLLAQIRHFGARADALPEWREAARIQDPDELWRAWPDLPVMTKRMFEERFPAAEIQERFHLAGKISASGGSTGEPTRFFHDTGMLRASVAANVFTRVRMGWRPGMATVILWGSERDIGRQVGWRARANSALLRDYMVDGYHLNHATVERVLEIIRAQRPVAFYGFTSMLEFVARTVVEEGMRLPGGSVRVAWNGGEMLFPEQSRLFEQAFGVPILNRYGGRELSAMACQFQAGGPLQVLRPWLFCEVVREDGRPAAPGETGRLLWTSTICRGTPFLRYDVEDLGAFAPPHLTDAGITALSELRGRTAGLFRLPDGRTINNLYWNHLFKEFPEVRHFQVVYLRSGEIRISLVGTPFSENRESLFRSMAAHLLAGIPLKLLWVEQVPRTVQSKLIQVIRETSPEGD